MKIHGVKAKVYLQYEGEIEKLSQKLSEGLIIPDFSFDNDEDPPHEIWGSCEALGFELWLRKSNELKGFSYTLELQTELSFEEIFNDQMYDISPWLAKYISKICKIDALSLNKST